MKPWRYPPITCSLENKKGQEAICPNKMVWIEPSEVLKEKRQDQNCIWNGCDQYLTELHTIMQNPNKTHCQAGRDIQEPCFIYAELAWRCLWCCLPAPSSGNRCWGSGKRLKRWAEPWTAPAAGTQGRPGRRRCWTSSVEWWSRWIRWLNPGCWKNKVSFKLATHSEWVLQWQCWERYIYAFSDVITAEALEKKGALRGLHEKH